MTVKRVAAILLCPAALLLADDPQLKRREPLPQNGVSEYRVDQGKRIPVRVLSTLYLKSAEHVDFQTVFPLVISGRTVIPAGSYLDAEFMGFRSAQRKKGRADLVVSLNRLILPNGEHRDLKGCLSSVRAATEARGSDLVVVPGTVTEVLLQDPLIFPIQSGAVRD